MRILVVEDEEQLREVVVGLLQAKGHAIVSAENGSKALEAYKASPEKFDLIITDRSMPEMGGEELAVKINALDSNVPFLFLSGLTPLSHETPANSKVQNTFLAKPFSRKDLLSKIDEIFSIKKS